MIWIYIYIYVYDRIMIGIWSEYDRIMIGLWSVYVWLCLIMYRYCMDVYVLCNDYAWYFILGPDLVQENLPRNIAASLGQSLRTGITAHNLWHGFDFYMYFIVCFNTFQFYCEFIVIYCDYILILLCYHFILKWFWKYFEMFMICSWYILVLICFYFVGVTSALQGWSRSLVTPACTGRRFPPGLFEPTWESVLKDSSGRVQQVLKSMIFQPAGCHVTWLGIGLGLPRGLLFFAFHDLFMIISCGNIVTIMLQIWYNHVNIMWHIHFNFISYSNHIHCIFSTFHLPKVILFHPKFYPRFHQDVIIHMLYIMKHSYSIH